MNTVEHIVSWAFPATYVAGIVFLILTPKFSGRGLLMGSMSLFLIVSVVRRVLPVFAEKSPYGGSGVDLGIGKNKAIWDAWESISGPVGAEAQALLLGFVILAWMHSRPQQTPAKWHGEVAGHSGQTVECSKCHRANPKGQVRCQNCRRSLQPTLLGVITVVGVLFNLMVVVCTLIYPFITHPIVPLTFLGVLTVLQVSAGLLLVLANLAARRGKHWAWSLLQWGYGFSVIAVVFAAAKTGGAIWGLAAGVAIVFSLLIYYFNTERVKNYCSAGRVAPFNLAGPIYPSPAALGEFKFVCPNCTQHIQVDSQLAGISVICPGCNHDIVVPEPLTHMARLV